MRNHNRRPFSLVSSLASQLLAIGSVLLLAGCAQLSLPPVASTSSPAEIEAQVDETDTETTAAEPEALPEPQEEPEPGKLYEWNGHGRDISHVVIDTNEQRARFYDGQQQVGWTTIASGVSSHPTPSGEFEVMEKVAKKRSNLYGRIYNANGGLHKSNAHSSDPVPAGGKFVGARMPHFMRMTYDGIGMHAGAIPSPGQPASHGCIRLPDEVATSLFAQTGIGTRVTVIGQGPDYGNYAERIRQQREQERLNRVAAAKAEARNNASERNATAAGTSADKRASSRPEQADDQPTTGRSTDLERTDTTTVADANGEELRREANETASTSSADTQTTERAQASSARTTDSARGTDESAGAKPSETSGALSEQDVSTPKDREQPTTRPEAATPAPTASPQQTDPSRSPAQEAPAVRSADQDESSRTKDEQI